MGKEVAVIAVHGIGSYAASFDDPDTRFDRHLLRGLRSGLKQDFDAFVRYEPVLWSDAKLERQQDTLLQENKREKLFRDLSSLVIESLSDASNYQYFGVEDSRFAGSGYLIANRLYHDALLKLQGRLTGGEAPLVIVAQSMGCHVTSSYQWDAAKDPRRILGPQGGTVSAFCALQTTASVFFTGCNVPILSMGVPREHKVPMRVPGPRAGLLPAEGTVWRNYFDPDDVLGFRMQPEFTTFFSGQHPSLKPAEGQAQVEDRRIEIQGLAGLTPFAHNEYWKDARVLKDIVAAIRALINRP